MNKFLAQHFERVGLLRFKYGERNRTPQKIISGVNNFPVGQGIKENRSSSSFTANSMAGSKALGKH